MPRRLLVVERTFVLRGRRGVLLEPFVPLDELEDLLFGAPIDMELRTVDGGARRTRAVLSIPRISGEPRATRAVVLLPDETAESVPAGTEVWTVA